MINKLKEAAQVPLPKTPIPAVSTNDLKEASQVPLPETPPTFLWYNSFLETLILLQPITFKIAKLKEASQIPLPETPPQTKSTKFIDTVMAAPFDIAQTCLVKFCIEGDVKRLREIVEKNFLAPLIASGEATCPSGDLTGSLENLPSSLAVSFHEMNSLQKYQAFHLYAVQKASIQAIQSFLIELGDSDEELKEDMQKLLDACPRAA
ncbi:hypothetical protein EYC80_004611 [Monilinia laxa]|uniref:Uncharacterized protein n=1 Tax=Monilinia laxa TaxID=61186 RepID=A0A5N6KHA1_MONLA|nr:hypothetical protein EYC80_004611 [Monilinia laxa]